jgi:hypothetical protein
LTDIFIAKYDAAGNYIWAKSFGDSFNDQSNSITIDNLGNVLFTGSFIGLADFDAGPGISNLYSVGGTAIFIAKYDNAGNYIWAKRITGLQGNNIGYSITTDTSGNVYSSGSFFDTIDFDPGIGLFYLTADDSNGYILKLNSSGNFVWVRQAGCGEFGGLTIKTDNLGNVYYAGNKGFCPLNFNKVFHETVGEFVQNFINPVFYIRKLNSSGNTLWSKDITSNIYGMGTYQNISISLDINSNLYVTGDFQNTCDFNTNSTQALITAFGGTDIFLAKYDVTGNFKWVRDLGGANNEGANSICIDSLNNLYITGYYNGTAGFDPPNASAQLTSVGSSDVFIAKYNSCINSDSTVQYVTLCNGQNLIVGAHTYSTSGTYVDYIANGIPCDGMVVTHLTVIPSYNYYSDIYFLCPHDSITIGGHTYFATGYYSDSCVTVNGCDSIVIESILVYPEVTTSVVAGTITAINISSAYQWLDCNNGFALISGANSQSYVATVNGSYAVVAYVGQGEVCIDTSACVTINNVGLNELNSESQITLFPNPANDNINIELLNLLYSTKNRISIYDVQGQILLEKYSQSANTEINISSLSSGIYFIKIQNGDSFFFKKFVKE